VLGHFEQYVDKHVCFHPTFAGFVIKKLNVSAENSSCKRERDTYEVIMNTVDCVNHLI